MKEILLLGVCFLILCVLDYIEWRDEMHDMTEDEEGEDD